MKERGERERESKKQFGFKLMVHFQYYPEKKV